MSAGGSRETALEGIAKEIAAMIHDGALLGLGSGSTVASILPKIAEILREGKVTASWVPTSLEIQLVAESLGLSISPLSRPSLALVLDGADQVDAQLNLVKGGGGALLKEKVLLSSTDSSIIVADEKKFAERLCAGGVRVPVEVIPFARTAAWRRLEGIGGGHVQLRLDQRGYPAYSENGNLLMDVLFEPIERPRELEESIKAIPGVVEAGIFTVSPIKVYKIFGSGRYEVLSG